MMRWAGHVACTGEKRNAYRVSVDKPEGNRLLERLKQILKKEDWKVWTRLIWLRLRTSGKLL
jgi:hypothetical protein